MSDEKLCCPLCEATFPIDSDELATHMRDVHGIRYYVIGERGLTYVYEEEPHTQD